MLLRRRSSSGVPDANAAAAAAANVGTPGAAAAAAASTAPPVPTQRAASTSPDELPAARWQAESVAAPAPHAADDEQQRPGPLSWWPRAAPPPPPAPAPAAPEQQQQQQQQQQRQQQRQQSADAVVPQAAQVPAQQQDQQQQRDQAEGDVGTGGATGSTAADAGAPPAGSGAASPSKAHHHHHQQQQQQQQGQRGAPPPVSPSNTQPLQPPSAAIPAQPAPQQQLQPQLSPAAAPPGAAPASAGDELPPGDEVQTQFDWEPRLSAVSCRKPAARMVQLATPTSSDWAFYSAHKDDAMLFNVSLVADASEPRPVRLAAVDLARNSAWFQAMTANRHALTGTEVGSVLVPCRMPQSLLEAMVGALYASLIELGPDSVEGVYRAADAMQMPALQDACESYLAATCFDDPEADPGWINAVYDLAGDIGRVDFAASLSRHFACAAQRDAAGRCAVLAHILASPPYAGDGLAQMELLRQGHQAAWNGQGPESLLVHVMLEVAEALSAGDVEAMLDKVEWATLQQEEVAALVDWVLAMPPSWPLTAPLKDRVLKAVSAQISGHHQRRYLVWRADVGRLPGAGQRLMSSGALTIGARRLYLCMERAGPSEWGLFLCPPPDVSLYSRVAFHTLFVLGPDFGARVATYDVTIAKDLRVGAGFGSRTIVTEWMQGARYKALADGSRHLTVGTIVTRRAEDG